MRETIKRWREKRSEGEKTEGSKAKKWRKVVRRERRQAAWKTRR